MKFACARLFLNALILSSASLGCPGCATTQRPPATEPVAGPRQPKAGSRVGATRPVYIHTNITVRPTLGQQLNPVWWFGNEDDPIPPDWYRPGARYRTGSWRRRNLLHNFTFYVIGIADKEFVREGRHPDLVFHPEQGWNWAVCKYKCVRLPFVSGRRGRFKFYCGWRERGNFGFKLNF